MHNYNGTFCELSIDSATRFFLNFSLLPRPGVISSDPWGKIYLAIRLSKGIALFIGCHTQARSWRFLPPTGA